MRSLSSLNYLYSHYHIEVIIYLSKLVKKKQGRDVPEMHQVSLPVL